MIEQTSETDRAPEYSDRYFRYLFESSDETAMVLLDSEGKITGWNRGAERLLGWSTDEALGQEGAIFFTEEDRTAGAPEEEVETAKERGWADDTRWHVKKNGDRFWANAVMEAIEDREGHVVGFAKFLRDRTDLKRYEKELERSNRRLESFASYVAHEIRSPLAGAKLMIDRLSGPSSDALDQEDKEHLRLIKSTLEDANRFVSDLLFYSRLGGGEEIKREPVSARSVAEEARGDIHPFLEETGAEIDIGDLPEVQANATYLRHLFRNLFSNAIRYNESDVPRVRVEACEQTDAQEEPSKEQKVWVFSVKDNGVGMSEEERAKVFELFERGAEEKEVGVGIGLALVKRVVEAHGGEIWAESEPGDGTTFFFTIPGVRSKG